MTKTAAALCSLFVGLVVATTSFAVPAQATEGAVHAPWRSPDVCVVVNVKRYVNNHWLPTQALDQWNDVQDAVNLNKRRTCSNPQRIVIRQFKDANKPATEVHTWTQQVDGKTYLKEVRLWLNAYSDSRFESRAEDCFRHYTTVHAVAHALGVPDLPNYDRSSVMGNNYNFEQRCGTIGWRDTRAFNSLYAS